MAKTIYLNVKYSTGRETVDSVEHNPIYWPTYRDMCKEARRLVSEYHMAGIPVYTSSRPCAGY